MILPTRGFTLIELLVVIAIIGILSSVVLASLNTARDKGANAAIKSNLANMRAQAEIIYDDTNSYATVCTNTTVLNAIAAAKQAAGAASVTVSNGTANTLVTPPTAACHSGVNGWAIEVPLKTSPVINYQCVDSTGQSTATPSFSITTGTDATCGLPTTSY
ncbi:MAG: type II secretion system protein [Patescibacteria group bacterium]